MDRYYLDKKEESDFLKKITIWKLNRWGYLKNGPISGKITWTHNWSGEESSVGIQMLTDTAIKRLRIYYTQTDWKTGQKTDYDYEIALTTVPCYFGSIRYFFTCPWFVKGEFCGRRVAVLYKGAKHFACRHCHNLTYLSRNQNRRGRLFPFGRMLDLESKIDRLQKEMVTKYYAGKPTRKYQRLRILQREAYGYGREFNLEDLEKEL